MHNYLQVTLSQTLTIQYVVNITQYLNVYVHCNKDTLK